MQLGASLSTSTVPWQVRRVAPAHAAAAAPGAPAPLQTVSEPLAQVSSPGIQRAHTLPGETWQSSPLPQLSCANTPSSQVRRTLAAVPPQRALDAATVPAPLQSRSASSLQMNAFGAQRHWPAVLHESPAAVQLTAALHSLQAFRVVLQPTAPQAVFTGVLPLQVTRVAPLQSAPRLRDVKLNPSLQRERVPPLQR